jgi:hypothetical protein
LISIGPTVAEEAISLETDPHNEVSEVWIEFRDGMVIVIVFCVLSFAIIYWTAGRSLRPLENCPPVFARSVQVITQRGWRRAVRRKSSIGARVQPHGRALGRAGRAQ